MRRINYFVCLALVAVVLVSAYALYGCEQRPVGDAPQVSFDVPIADKDAQELAVVHEGSEIDEWY